MSFPKINPTTTKSWQLLEEHQEEIKTKTIASFFEEDVQRFENFHLNLADFTFDFSKNRLEKKTLNLLVSLAKECRLKEAMSAFLTGEKINETEGRAVLHPALRGSIKGVKVDGISIDAQIEQADQQIKKISDRINSDKWFTDDPVEDVVSIGIGGSHLGPEMLVKSMKSYTQGKRIHYISNMDPANGKEVLAKLNAKTTLFIVSTKSFGTKETLANAEMAKKWLIENKVEDIAPHFIAVTAAKEKAEEFGVKKENIVEFQDWVGGRFSLWGPVGISIVIAIGYANFERFRAGAREMDQHFFERPLDKNIPVLMALIGIWYTNFFHTKSQAISPYSKSLTRLVPYLQQLDMESNGKKYDRNGEPIDYQTAGVIWGNVGTNSQHAFFQLLHQGTQLIPIDFIVPMKPLIDANGQHLKLVANALAQSHALAFGKKDASIHLHFEGNKPSNVLAFEKLSPRNVGRLIALYEHKVFVQGVIWNINSFDQFGVELGKVVADELVVSLEGKKALINKDASTEALMEMFLKYNS